MVTAELLAITITTENWGESEKDFWIVVQADIGPNIGNGSETFTFNVVSPMRLQKVVELGDIELGRGKIITNDFELNRLEELIRNILSSCSGNNWCEVANAISRYAIWELEE